MKTIRTWYNPAQKRCGNASRINLTSLFSWITVLLVIVLFWAGVAVIYKRDYVSHAVAKIEHQEKKFLAAHRTLQKKTAGNHILI